MSQVTVSVIFVLFIAYVIWQGMKNFYLRSLNSCIKKKDWDTIQKITDMKLSVKLLGEYTCDLYQLRGFYLSKNIIEFEKKAKEMSFKTCYNLQEKKDFLEQYYHIFLLKNDKKHAEFFLNEIRKIGDKQFEIYNEQSFYIMIDKRTDLIKPMIDEINSKKYYGFALGVILFMIAKQYEYLKDEENAKTYYKNAKICFHPKAIYMKELKSFD